MVAGRAASVAGGTVADLPPGTRACTPEGPDRTQTIVLRSLPPPPAPAPPPPPPPLGGSAVEAARRQVGGCGSGRRGVMDTEARDKAVYLAKLAEQAERYDGTSGWGREGRGL